ncbi:MAG: YitT family protein [Oscillospiraceae bacterium]|nr:YitT family protein [Oscillospiraceae bacterium]
MYFEVFFVFRSLTFKTVCLSLLGSAILAFGLYNVHAFSGVTEGGQLGLTLLLDHWFHISPAFSTAVINVICYWIGWKALGKSFIAHSAVATGGFSLIYWICQQFPPLWPNLANYPLAAAVLGACFVGLGCGLCVRVGGAACGDDGLAMSISDKLNIKIEYVYFFFDFTILTLSLTYIPIGRILYSLVTVMISSKIVGLVQRFQFPKKERTHA